jgi:hypothetical protein
MSNDLQNDDQAGSVRQRQPSRMTPAEMRAEIGARTAQREPAAAPRERRAPASRRKSDPTEGQSFFARLFARKSSTSNSPRQNCCIVGVLMLLDRALALDGLVLELGADTLLFRQGAHFIFDRNGAEVSIRFGEFDRRGRITDVSKRGYVITLFEPLQQDELARLMNSHGLPG